MTDFLHSSALPPGAPLLKCPTGKTRRDERAERKAAEDAAWLKCCKAVDKRDGHRCRCCGRPCSPTAIDMLERGERHHIVKRGQGGEDVPENVLMLCKACHDDVHVHGTLALEGDASAVDETGRFCGVTYRELTETGWTIKKVA